ATLRLAGECPACGQAVTIAFDAGELPRASEGEEPPYGLEHDGAVIRFRLPDNTDLEAPGRCRDLERARKLLLDRCVVAGQGADGVPCAGSALPPAAQEALEREMDRRDPLAAMEVELDCPDCAHRWESRCDLSEVVWLEFAGMARRLMDDVAA